jgi:uncharacterized membrane protein
MNLALFSSEGFLYFLRWFHYFFGVAWIGLLYYFNFVQTPFMGDATTDAGTKSTVTRGLVPRALWWFRWAAMFTFLTGFTIFMIRAHQNPASLTAPWGVGIITGASMAILMFLNVWLIIWPNQKVIIANANNVAAGQPANPNVAAHAARAGVASRTNVLFSLPMLFFMGAGRYLPWQPAESLVTYYVVFGLIIGVIEFNAIKGKMVKPLSTVKDVIHWSLALWLVIYLLFEFFATSRM